MICFASWLDAGVTQRMTAVSEAEKGCLVRIVFGMEWSGE